MSILRFVAAAVAALPLAASAVVIDTLPWNTGVYGTTSTQNSAEWTVVAFAGTSLFRNGTQTQTLLTTANVRGVYFGNMTGTLDSPPNWLVGNTTQGNQLRLDLSFSTVAADWYAYVRDGSHIAQFAFRPTGCSPGMSTATGCYGVIGQLGFSYLVPSAANPAVAENRFVALDMSERHSFEWLLKAGQVSYAVDGQLLYSGPALATSGGSGLLIGDSSGSSYSGVGSMTVHGVRVDTAPAAMSLVPEPGIAWLWMAGLGGLALPLKRRLQDRRG